MAKTPETQQAIQSVEIQILYLLLLQKAERIQAEAEDSLQIQENF